MAYDGAVSELAVALKDFTKVYSAGTAEIGRKFVELEKRLDSIEEKLEKVIDGLIGLNEKIDAVEEGVGRKIEDMKFPTLDDLFEPIEEDADAGPAGSDDVGMKEGDVVENADPTFGILVSVLRDYLRAKGHDIDEETCKEAVGVLLMSSVKLTQESGDAQYGPA